MRASRLAWTDLRKRAAIGGAIIVTTVAAAIAAGGAVGVFDGRNCSVVGCEDGVFARISTIARDEPTTYVRICATGRCDKTRVDLNRPTTVIHLPCPEFESEQPVEITAQVLNQNGRVKRSAVRVDRSRAFEPNGRECGPTCWTSKVGFDVRSGQFVSK